MSYRRWLWHQHRRDDAVGDLARDCRRDPGLRGRHLTPRTLLRYVHERGACDGAVMAAIRAGREYNPASLPQRIRVDAEERLTVLTSAPARVGASHRHAAPATRVLRGPSR
jgi:hypothetical protein